jgi:hypothetical protein
MKQKTHANMENLIGRKFSLLTVVSGAGKAKDGHRLWACKCECGNTTIAASNSLKHGMKKSCGCLRSVASKKRIKRDGVWNDGKSYSVQSGSRCYKTKHGWAKAVLRHYGEKCMICGWNKAPCDVHHKKAKAIGGLHTIDNGIVLCPNCHREIHSMDAGK